MRHGKKMSYLGRTSSHRRAMLRNMANSLIEHKSIKTTVQKAKALRVFIEPIITKSKEDTMHSRRVVFSYLQNKEAVKELFGEIAEKVSDRPGGYTRILKLGNRRGDNAEMALVELVDYNEYDYSQNKGAGGKGKKRRRRKKSGGATKAKAAEAPAVTNDDLTKIEGIGPKVQETLNAAGITTFAQLTEAGADKLKEILTEAGGAMKSMNPTTWGDQAQLAADGKWDELTALQDELDGGKIVEAAEEVVEEATEAVEEVAEEEAPAEEEENKEE
ncbi:MAG: 50S ribosomal protein L17 [Bacteroidota bacterium]